MIVLFSAVSSLYLRYKCCGKSRSRVGFHHGGGLVVCCVMCDFFCQEFWFVKNFGRPVAWSSIICLRKDRYYSGESQVFYVIYN